MQKEFIELALIKKCNWFSNTLVPEVEITYPDAVCRADMLRISASGYVTEFEIKCSRQDWENDRNKAKWRHGLRPYIKRFIYVVPNLLKEPEWVPSKVGIWRVDDEGTITVTREGDVLGTDRVPNEKIREWKNNFYYRYWDARLHLLLSMRNA